MPLGKSTMRKPRTYFMALYLAVGVLLVSACGTPNIKSAMSVSTMIPRMVPTTVIIEMPDFVQSGLPNVQAAYKYAVSNPYALTSVPCYCGCSRMGHRNNLDCYIKSTGSDGKITFDNHAAFCGVCVNITTDVMRLKKEGNSASQIRAYIDTQYNSVGPSTDTALPVEI